MEIASTLSTQENEPSSTASGSPLGWRVAIGAIVGALLASGLLMRIGSMRPSNLLGAAIHTRTLFAHGALALAAFFCVLVRFAPSRRVHDGLRFTLIAAHAVGALAIGFSDGSQAAVVVGCALSLASMLAYAVVMLDVKSWLGGLFLVAMLGQMLAWLGTMFAVDRWSGASLYPLVLAVVAAPSLPPRARPRPAVLFGVVVYLLARAGLWSVGLSPLAIVEIVAGCAIGVAFFRAARSEPETWPRWARCVQAALFIESVLLTSFVGFARDVHLGDTLFVVGVGHLEGLILVFALLESLVNASRRWWGRAGFILAAVGAHVFDWGLVALGSSGAPRRYAQYLDELATAQAVVSIASFVLAVGIVASLLAFFSARRRLGSRPG